MTIATRATFTGSSQLPNTPTSAATPADITDDTKYNAWPVICRARNGDVLVGYTKADNHHADTSGNAMLKRSTDDGATWGSEVTIYDHASLFATVYGLGVTQTGRIIATLWRDNPAVSGSGEAGIVYSDDHGATWSAWVALSTSFTQEDYGAGPAIVCGNGDLLLTVEGSYTGDAILERGCHTLRSTDDGLTWGSEVTVRDYATDTRPYYESKLQRLRDGTVRCLHRTSSASPGTHYVSTSTDDGLTWGSPASIFAGNGAPSVCRLSNDDLVAVTRANSSDACIAYTSEDGLTWGSAISIDATDPMMYGAPIQLRDGTVLVVYGLESSSTNSDIKACVLT